MTRTRVSAAAILMGVALAGGLTACGSDDDSTSSTSTSSAATSEATESETSEATTESASPEASESASPATSDTAGSGEKPAKEDVVSGYSKIVSEMAGGAELPQDQIDQATSCIVDEIYDDASAATLQALADGNAAGVDPADAQAFTDASTTCMQSLAG